MEQKRKAYNEKQAGIRSSAPYDWSVETCMKYSGVTKHIFHNVLKEPYCTKDQNNSYGIPSELGAFVCAYAYAVKSYKDCSEKDPGLRPISESFSKSIGKFCVILRKNSVASMNAIFSAQIQITSFFPPILLSLIVFPISSPHYSLLLMIFL